MNTKKGFTLIELLVVVAIIGILATVVLASLGQARSRARDAAIKAAISSLRSDMELHFIDNNTYEDGTTAGTCEATVTGSYATSVTAQGSTLNCDASATAYSAEALLNNGNYFCVDSTGFAAEGGTTATGAANGTTADTAC